MATHLKCPWCGTCRFADVDAFDRHIGQHTNEPGIKQVVVVDRSSFRAVGVRYLGEAVQRWYRRSESLDALVKRVKDNATLRVIEEFKSERIVTLCLA